MSMEHKAFEFDWNSFESELLAIFRHLDTKDAEVLLESFINKNIDFLTDPYEGNPLDTNWRDNLEAGGVQELADIALTKYYDVKTDFGLANHWLSIECNVSVDAKCSLLGEPIAGFDPGYMGSYFQSSEQLKNSVSVLSRECIEIIPDFVSELKTITKGVYVTF